MQVSYLKWIENMLLMQNVVACQNVFNWAENMFHPEIFTFSSAFRASLDLIPPRPTLSHHKYSECLNKFVYDYKFQYFLFYLQIGNVVQAQGCDLYIRYLLLNKICCLTTQSIRNIDDIWARWKLRYYSFTVKWIGWCTYVRFLMK